MRLSDENTRECRHLTPEERIALQAEEIKQLWQENEQLRARVAQYREALIIANHRMPDVEALSDTPADYHNPADVEALRKAREAIQRAKENFEPYGEYEYDVRYDLEEALAEIDRVIGGKEDV